MRATQIERQLSHSLVLILLLHDAFGNGANGGNVCDMMYCVGYAEPHELVVNRES